MAEAGDLDQLRSKRKAITTLLPYAVRQELCGQPEMLDTFLCAARASGMWRFRWYRVEQSANVILSKATPSAIILVSPHVPWGLLEDGGDLVQRWGVATSMVPYTEEVAQSVVDTLLQIADISRLLPHIPVGAWSWLTKRPSLPPVCLGRYLGTGLHIIMAVQRLKDIDILKSYLLLTWSEWDSIRYGSLNEIHSSIHVDFGGAGMGHHRADLIKRLDDVLGQLDLGLSYLRQRNPDLREGDFRDMKHQYGQLRKTLLEVNIGAITRTSDPLIALLCKPTQTETRRILRNVYVRSSSPVSVVWNTWVLLPTPLFIYASVSLRLFSTFSQPSPSRLASFTSVWYCLILLGGCLVGTVIGVSRSLQDRSICVFHIPRIG